MGWGDEMMASGEVASIYQGKPIAILRSPESELREHEAWINNPQIAKPWEDFDRFIINGPGHRPYVHKFQHDRWTWKPYKPKPGKLFFTDEEIEFSNAVRNIVGQDFVAIEPNCKDKQESVNRDWGWKKWSALADLLLNQSIKIVQFGPFGTRLLSGSIFIETKNPRLMAAGLRNAKAFISTEGGFHHTAAALNLPGVVLFGHFISPDVTGYEMHRNLWSGQIGCGLRISCSSCKSYFSALQPEDVAKELMKILS